MHSLSGGLSPLYSTATPKDMDPASLAAFKSEIEAHNFTTAVSNSLLLAHPHADRELELWARSLQKLSVPFYILSPTELAFAFGPPESNIFNTNYDNMDDFLSAKVVLIRHLFFAGADNIMSPDTKGLVALGVEQLVLGGITVVGGTESVSDNIDIYGGALAAFIEEHFELIDATAGVTTNAGQDNNNGGPKAPIRNHKRRINNES